MENSFTFNNTSTDVYAHLYLGSMLHTQEASEVICIVCVLLCVGVAISSYRIDRPHPPKTNVIKQTAGGKPLPSPPHSRIYKNLTYLLPLSLLPA